MQLPLPRPVVTPVHYITSIDCVLATLATDEGPRGLSYLWCFGLERARVLRAMVEDLFRVVEGADPLDRVLLTQRLWHDINFLGRTGVAVFGLSAIEIALWDLAGKIRGEPLCRLLGGTPRPIPTYAGGLFLSDPVDTIVEEAKGYVAAGFRAMKMRAGARRWQEDVERVEAVRQAIGPDVALMVDVVQGWAPEMAIRIGREIARFDLTWIEDPVLFDDHAGLAAVAAALDTPIAAGENDYGLLGFRRLFDARAVDIAMPDLQRAGGIAEWLRIAALAASAGVRVTPHVFHEVASHLLAAVPDALWAEYVPWWDVLFQEPVLVSDGAIRPPERPGLGLAFDWDRLDRHRTA